MQQFAYWVIGEVFCLTAKWVNGTDLSSPSHWGFRSEDCPTAYWVMRIDFCSLSRWGFGSENCPTAQWVKQTDLCPSGIALREGSNAVASFQRRRVRFDSRVASSLNMIAAHENALAGGPGRRDEA